MCHVPFHIIHYIAYRSCERTLAKKQKKKDLDFIPLFQAIPPHNYDAFTESTGELFAITFYELSFNTLGERSKDVVNGTL